jgi:hypothetical protein
MYHKELVDYYYDRISHFITNKKIKELSYEGHSYQDVLNKIIEDGNEYLLVDSYLRYIVHSCQLNDDACKQIYNSLAAIASNDHKFKVNEMTYYFKDIIEELSYIGKDINPSVLVKDQIYIDLINVYSEFYKKIKINTSIGCRDRNILKNTLCIILATCLVDGEFDRCREYCNCLYDNYREFLDFFALQGARWTTGIQNIIEACSISDLCERLKGKIH